MISAHLHNREHNKLPVFEKLILAGMGLCLALQLYLQFVQKINWDEFYYLSQIYEFQRGALSRPLQTLHVHTFAWLTAIDGTEIRQITIARVVMWAFEIATLYFIYAVARAFVSRQGALISALAYISSGVVLIHGTSFRTDPTAACAMMYCLFVLVRSNLSFRNLASFAVVAAIAALITVKVIFFAPALFGVAIWRIKNSDRPNVLLAHLAGTAAVTVGLAALLYGFQLWSMPHANSEVARQGISSAFVTTLLSEGLFPRRYDIVFGMRLAPIQTLSLFLSLMFALFNIVRPNKAQAQTAILVLVLATPLLSFIFYRNAFLYFFAFIFPSSMVLIGYFTDRIKAMQLAIAILCIIMVGRAFYITDIRRAENLLVQRETIQAVHQIFDAPVNYIDRNSMIASFPKRGFFMSSWGYKNYVIAGEAIYARILDEEVTPLLIINSPILEVALLEANADQNRMLLDEDIKVLQDNFIPHWGHLWVAGKQLTANVVVKDFMLSTPGDYTVEADIPINIDGRTHQPAAVVNLSRGTHVVSAKASTSFTLRWGDHLLVPSMPASPDPIFTGF